MSRQVWQTRVTEMVRVALRYARHVASFRSLLTHRARAADQALPSPPPAWSLRRALARLFGR